MRLYKEVLAVMKGRKILLLIYLLLLSIVALTGPLSLYAQAYFIDSVSEMIGREFSFSALIFPMGLLAISLFLPMFEIILDYVGLKINFWTDLNWNKRINEILSQVPYYHYEQEETYDKIWQMRENHLYSMIIGSFFSTISVIIMVSMYLYILLSISIWLAVSIIVFAPLVGYYSAKIASKQYNKIYSLNPDRRRTFYKSSILRMREHAKDIRVNLCGEYMVDDWLEVQKNVDSKTLQVKFKYGLLGAVVGKTEFVVIFINLIIVLLAYRYGNMTLGIFISISNQIFSMRLFTKIQNLSSQIKNTNSLIKSYGEVLLLMEENELKMINDEVIIEFKHVYFKYPKEDNYVLEDITLEIKWGESIALVGENGAGKSTFIKLLLGLYSPNRGEILVNNISISSLSAFERSKIFGVAFQDYSKFCLTFKENLMLNEEAQDFSRIAREFHLDNIADSLNDGYYTLLGKSFGKAIDLSGGQWQTIAIARALIGNKKVFIFDEPTASLDPINEVKTFTKIRDLTRNCTSIYITHRLGFTSKVDRIILLKDNKVCEDGSFSTLMDLEGEFKKLFQEQKNLYVRRGVTI